MRLSFLAAALGVLAMVTAAWAQPEGGRGYGVDEPGGLPKGARLVWSDEFERSGAPDPAKWAFDTHRNKQGWYNEERQYYAASRPENARVERGLLVIEARQEDFGRDKPADWGGQRYTSAKLQTKGLAAWTYGFFEVRAKLPCGRGVWPAIWMLPEEPSAPWPHGGEIDIMEHVGWDEGVVHGTVHSGGYNHVHGKGRGASIKLPDVCGAFHRYQLDWSPERILIGVDDRVFVRIPNTSGGDPGAWPFYRPQYLILNVAVGGWGGRKGVDDAVFPVRMEVDYARVYDRPN